MKFFVISPGIAYSGYSIIEMPQARFEKGYVVKNEELLLLLEWYAEKKPDWGDPSAFVIDNSDANKETCFWIGQFYHALKRCKKTIRFTKEGE